jgi:hypothetical protein
MMTFLRGATGETSTKSHSAVMMSARGAPRFYFYSPHIMRFLFYL